MTINRREFLKVSASAAAILATGESLAQAPKLRKEVRTLTSAEVASLRAGVSAMKALPRDNFRSWDYQRAVHSIPAGPPPDPPGVAAFWRQCNHHTPHFFDWHRWELLYWEEICRQLCGDATFTLPYWDYFTNGFLPDAFRDPAPNVLFHARNAALNNGTAQLPTIATPAGPPAITPSGIGETDFFAFQGQFEFSPHDLVHGAIGGSMGSVPTAALDPIFYLHHANVDRYWATWLKQGGGRVNPGGAWAATSFNFQALAGPQTPTAGAAGTPETLGYTYDLPKIDPAILEGILRMLRRLRLQYKFPRPRPIPPRPPEPGPWRTLGALQGIRLDGNPTVIPVPKEGAAARLLGQSLASRGGEVALVLHGVKATKLAEQGGYVYQIFLAPSEKALAAGRITEATEVGSFSSFSVSGADHHGVRGHAPRVAIPMSTATKRLLAKSLNSDPAFVFVRRGLISNGKEIQDQMDETFFTIEEIRVEARKREM